MTASKPWCRKCGREHRREGCRERLMFVNTMNYIGKHNTEMWEAEQLSPSNKIKRPLLQHI
jgi:hypothetical protein